jgi:hypothetical protein
MLEDESLKLLLQRMAVTANPTTVSVMKRYAAAATMLIAGKRGHDMTAPEPYVQVGFEPDEQEMELIVYAAERNRRDLVHISCHPTNAGLPTGMISVVFFDGDRAWSHRRAGLLCEPKSKRVILSGVSDDEDENCHFVMSAGRKMTRVVGHPVRDIARGMHRAGKLWHKLARSPQLGNCDDEILTMYATAERGSEFARNITDLSRKTTTH